MRVSALLLGLAALTQAQNTGFVEEVYSSSLLSILSSAFRFASKKGSRIVPAVNYDGLQSGSAWTASGLGTFLNRNRNYALIHHAYFTPSESGDYVFHATCDDGCRVMVDGADVLPSSAYRFQGPTRYQSSAMSLTARKSYKITTKWFVGFSGGTFVLKVSGTAQGYATPVLLQDHVTPNPGPFFPSIKFGNALFATLDGAEPENTLDGGCQGVDTFLPVPDGWSIATNTPDARAMLGRFNFGTTCVVFADGSSVFVGVGAGPAPGADARCNVQLATTSAGTSVSACSARVLIQRTPPSDDKSPDFRTATLGEPIAFEGKLFVPLDGANALDGSNQGTGCSTHAALIPAGYQIAAANNHTLAAIAGSRHRFGARCVVLADGNFYDSQTAGPCPGVSASNGIARIGDLVYPSSCPARILLESSTQQPGSLNRELGCVLELQNSRTTKAFTRLTNLTPAKCATFCRSKNLPFGAMFGNSVFCSCSDSKPSGGAMDPALCSIPCSGNSQTKCGGSFDSSLGGWPASVLEVGYVNTDFASSWDAKPEPKASVIRPTFMYGTLDGADPHDCTSGCQGVSYLVPSGWELVPKDDPELGGVLQANPFATDCYVLADGSAIYSDGAPCGSNVLTTRVVSGSVFHAVSKCNARILMRKQRVVEANSLCAAASGVGDPHYTTFDKRRYSNQDEGEHVLAAPTQLPVGYDSDYNAWRVHAIQRRAPPTRASVNEAILIKQGNSEIGLYLKNENLQDALQLHTRSGRVPLTNRQSHDIGTPGTSNHISVMFRTGAVTSTKWGPRYTTWSYADIRLASGVRVVVRTGMWHISYLNVYVFLPSRWRGITHGLLGSCDGNARNDFRTPAGTLAPSQSSFVASFKAATNGNPSIAPLPFAPSSGALPPASTGCAQATAAVKSLARDACAPIHSPELRQQCEFDVCATGDDSAAFDAIRNAATERMIALGANGTCTKIAVSGLQTFSAYDRTYALLDGSSPDTMQSTCTINSYTVPSGWAVARDIPVNRAILPCHTWGGGCVVFANGKAYDSNLRLCGDNQLRFLAPSDSGPDAVCYGTNQRNRHILLVKQETEVVIANGDFAAVDTAGVVSGWSSWPSAAVMSYTRIPNNGTADPVDGAIRVEAAAMAERHGVVQEISFPEGRTTPFSISAWAKSEGVSPGTLGDYALYVDLVHTDSSLGTKIAEFAAGTQDWHRRVVDIAPSPGKSIARIRVHLLLRNRIGVALFGNVVADIPTGAPHNVLVDPHVMRTSQSPWISDGAAWESSSDDISAPAIGGTQSIRVRSAGPSDNGITYQGVTLQQSTATKWDALYVGGYSKASAARSLISPDYSLYTDVTYAFTPGTPTADRHEYGLIAPFAAQTEWGLADRAFRLRFPVQSLSFNVLYRKQPAGTHAVFDDLWVLPTCARGITGDETKGGQAYGDPHLVSFDGKAFDVQTPGEYTLVAGDDISVQARFEVTGNGVASVTSAVAMRFGAEGDWATTEVEIKRNPSGAGKDPLVRISPASGTGGDSTTLPAGGSASNNRGVTVSRSGGSLADGPITYTVQYTASTVTGQASTGPEGGDVPTLTRRQYAVRVVVLESASRVQFLQVNTALPPGISVAGLLGNADGDASNDFELSDGSVLANPTPEAVESTFAASWRITDAAASHFSYVPQDGDRAGPREYHDPSFKPPTVDSFPQAARDAADRMCAQVGLPSASLRTACVKDALFMAANSGTDAESFTAVAYGQAAADARSDDELNHDSTLSPAPGVPRPALGLAVVAAIVLFAAQQA